MDYKRDSRGNSTLGEYYKPSLHCPDLVNKRLGGAAGEETQHVANEINSVILNWVFDKRY
ncbi:MAG TPA: hypothetical protein VF233_00065 [Nitrososphaeraceae archaeon]